MYIHKSSRADIYIRESCVLISHPHDQAPHPQVQQPHQTQPLPPAAPLHRGHLKSTSLVTHRKFSTIVYTCSWRQTSQQQFNADSIAAFLCHVSHLLHYIYYQYKRKGNSDSSFITSNVQYYDDAKKVLSPIAGPPGTLVHHEITPGQYAVRAIARAEGEVARTSTVALRVPKEDDSCAAHPINRGVTIEGNSASIEFSSVGGGSAFHCRYINDGRGLEPCKFCRTKLWHQL